MKILWFSWTFITAEPWHQSLRETGHEVDLRFYADKLTRPVGLIPCPPDRAMLDIAAQTHPDLILICGLADAAKSPHITSLVSLRQFCPVVLLSGDLSDPPWWPFIKVYAARGCFDLIVNFDGNTHWPKSDNSLDLLTPIPQSFFPMPKPLTDRLIPFGWAGGAASPSRAEIINYLREHAGLKIMPRDERYGTYQRYANFLMECKLTVNVPHSGSDNSEQVKGRVLESGLAGTCLIEHEASAAKNWFEPGVDYAVYRTKEEAAAIAKQLLADLPRAQAIALSLQRKVREHHSPDIFWRKVFEAVGMK